MSVNSKQFKDNGTVFYPETHIEVVIDGNGNTLDTLLTAKEATTNKVSSVSSSSTNTQYAGAKAVYDAVNPAVASTQPAGGMLPNICYEYGTLSADTTFALDSTNVDSSIVNIYYWIFSTSSTAPTITFPNDITAWAGNCLSNGAPVIAASKRYEISVKDGVAFIIES